MILSRWMVGVLAGLAVLVPGGGPVLAVDLGDGRIRLRNEAYDLAAGPAPDSARLPAPAAEAVWVVAAAGPADAAVRRAVVGAGGRVVGYVPSNAFLVRATGPVAERLRSAPEVARVDLYRAAWKISPDIGRRPFRDPARVALGAKRLLNVAFFEGADPLAVAEQLRRSGAEVAAVHATLGARRVVVVADPSVVPVMAALPDVEWIDEVEEIELRNDAVRWVIQSNVQNVTPLYGQGLFGTGEIIGHLDGEILLPACHFRDPVDNTPGPAHRKVVGYRSGGNTSGLSHGTHTAGTAAGDREPIDGVLLYRGMAPKARLSFGNVNDVTGLGNTTSNLLVALEAAHADGARVHTNSWGEPPNGPGSYTTLTLDVDTFTRNREDDLVVFAIANSSTGGKVLAPENAKNCLAVAATQGAPFQDLHGHGVAGPTYDGRRKPEVMAPGRGTISAAALGCATVAMSGTSMACPAVAGGAALVREYFGRGFFPSGQETAGDEVTPTGALLKAMMINSTTDVTGEAGYPSIREGWGRILVEDALYFAGNVRGLDLRDVRHASGLSTGEMTEFVIDVATSLEPLDVTMVFTDQPAALGAALAPVNDLDLEVEGPDGLFLGNVFDTGSGVSVTGGAADALNNAERVRLAAPSTGSWTVRVRGASVPMGPQGYAVVANGAFEIVAQADLLVEKAVDDPAPAEGDTLAYTVVLTNTGPDPATGVVVTDQLPAGVTYLSHQASQGAYADSAGSWAVDSLGVSGVDSLIIVAVVDAGTGGQTIVNTASLQALDQRDTNHANNTATASISLNAPPIGSLPKVTGSPGTQLTIRAILTDPDGVKSAQLFYRAGGATAFLGPKAMLLVAGEWLAGIPGNEVTAQGIEYYVLATDNQDATSRIPATGVATVTLVTEEPLPEAIALAVGPNPFSLPGGVTVSLALPQSASVDVRVYDGQGKLVRILAGGTLGPGVHPFTWDGRTEGGDTASTGVYFLRARAGGSEQRKKIVLIR